MQPAIEAVEARTLFSGVVAAATNVAQPHVATVIQAAPAPRRVFLTGNSMTDGVNYTGLAALLGSDGASVSLGRQTGSGFSQYQNATLQPGYVTSGIDPARPGNIDPWGNYKDAFASAAWDVLTIQPHDRRLVKDVYADGHDEAEVPNSMTFLRAMAANNPKGQVFVYSRAARRTDVDSLNNPTGLPFDYSTQWTKTYNDKAPPSNPHDPSTAIPFESRSRMQQLMPLLKSAQQADATTKGLPTVRIIPVGEAYYDIDQELKAGKFSGTAVHSMLDLYRDQSHPTDLASYVEALTFYASITGHDPRGVKPPSQYLGSGSKATDAKVQTLVQQAVYDAVTSSYYSGYLTPIGNGTPPPPPPPGTATFRGYVVKDKNANGKWDSGETGITGRTVWMDLDNDGVKDANEPTAVTGANGVFEFKNVAAGTVYVREVLPSGSTQTSPTKNGALTAKLTAGQVKSGQYFMVKG